MANNVKWTNGSLIKNVVVDNPTKSDKGEIPLLDSIRKYI